MKINYFDKRIQFQFFFKEGTKYTYNHENVPHNKHRTTKLHAKVTVIIQNIQDIKKKYNSVVNFPYLDSKEKS